MAYQENGSKTLTSLEADVQLVTKNLRKPTLVAPPTQYRLHEKIIDGLVYVRRDFEIIEKGVPETRAVVTNGLESVLFSPQNPATAQRIPVAGSTKAVAVPPNAHLGKRIPNLPLVLQRLAKRSYTLRETPEGRVATAEWKGRASWIPGQTLQRRTLQFDAVDAVLHSEETLAVDTAGVKTTVKTEYEYADTPAGPVVAVKTVTTTTDYPFTIDVHDRTLPRVDQLSDLPMVTEQQLEAQRKEGLLIYPTVLQLGDPANPQEITQTIETYSNIALNQADDALFRLVR